MSDESGDHRNRGVNIIDSLFCWLMNEPPSFGKCPDCRRWFVFWLLRQEPGEFGPTKIYLCPECGHEKRYESLPPRSPYTLG
jgi:hypothetical protein